MSEIGAHGIYWLCIVLMMTGFYTVISRDNLVKKIMGLNIFQVSVIMFYVALGKIRGGTAPILVMWFGFDWQSKAAVVVVMVFFPILVNTVAGLADTSSMQRDLMRTYSASYWQMLFSLRVPKCAYLVG